VKTLPVLRKIHFEDLFPSCAFSFSAITFPFRGLITLNVLSLHVVANWEPFKLHEIDSGKSEWQSIDTRTKKKFQP
jgi:hypothetical protein